MSRPPSEPRASRSVAGRAALSLVVGLSADSQVVLIKFRFIRGATETVHLPRAVAALLLDWLAAAESEKSSLWEVLSASNVNAQRLLAVTYPRLTDEDYDPTQVGVATDLRLGVADKGAIVEFILSNGPSRMVGFAPTVARYLREQLQFLQGAGRGSVVVPTEP
jgi:hypothetical protein